MESFYSKVTLFFYGRNHQIRLSILDYLNNIFYLIFYTCLNFSAILLNYFIQVTASQTKSLPEPSKSLAKASVSNIEPKVEPTRSSVAPKIPPISVSPETPRSAADEWIHSARKENESARQEKTGAASLEKVCFKSTFFFNPNLVRRKKNLPY